jgi:ribosomal protein S18 acetylase RimI-like enzyme
MSKQSYRSKPSTQIRPLLRNDLEAVVDLSLLAWAPVFVSFETILGTEIFDQIYCPDPRTAQATNVRKTCSADDVEAFVVVAEDGVVAGFIALRQHADVATGEVQMIAVHPQHQRRGHARALVEFAFRRFRDQGLPLVNVGTGGDPGHTPARALYEAVGFTGLPLVNYYKAVEARQG